MDTGYLWFSASLTRSETLSRGTPVRMRCNVHTRRLERVRVPGRTYTPAADVYPPHDTEHICWCSQTPGNEEDTRNLGVLDVSVALSNRRPCLSLVSTRLLFLTTVFL